MMNPITKWERRCEAVGRAKREIRPGQWWRWAKGRDPTRLVRVLGMDGGGYVRVISDRNYTSRIWVLRFFREFERGTAAIRKGEPENG